MILELSTKQSLKPLNSQAWARVASPGPRFETGRAVVCNFRPRKLFVGRSQLQCSKRTMGTVASNDCLSGVLVSSLEE